MSSSPNNADSDVGCRKPFADRNLSPYLLIVFGLAVAFVVLGKLPAMRVGDGSEYYALYLAFKATMRPWLSDASFAEYARLVREGGIIDMVPVDALANFFPALKLGQTADFNHFWLYSFLAYAVAAASGSLGLQLSAHSAFIALHWLLLCVPVVLAYKFFGWRGVTVVIWMALSSPLLWFANKVHTEFFTSCLALVSVICVMRYLYVPAALCMALASTQNPSFAVLAGLLLLLRAYSNARGRYGVLELVGVVSSVLLVFLHPIYYFFRYGVPTPQLLAGGATVGGNLANSYIWLLDPDVGLLPNWPLGFLMFLALLVAACLARRRVFFGLKPVGFFSIAYLGVSLFAQSSTTNLNSAGTVGVARYALWYVPLFFPWLLLALEWMKEVRWRAISAGIVFGGLLFVSVVDNYPSRGESNSVPSRMSYFVQSYLPWFYNPPAEIFLERFSGVGESGANAAILAVVGPDCRKVLLLPGAARSRVASPPECGFNAELLSVALKERHAEIQTEVYSALDEDIVSLVKFVPAKNRTYSLAAGGEGGVVLRKGWSIREGWGVWTEGRRAELVFPCGTDAESNGHEDLLFSLVGFTHANRPTTALTIFARDVRLWSGEVNDTISDIKISVPQAACSNGQVFITLRVGNPESPMKAKLSSDSRELGVGFVAFKYPHES